MKHILFIFIGVLIYSISSGQSVTIIKNEKIVKQIDRDFTDACDKSKKSWVVHDLPVYKGGEAQLKKDIKNIVTIDKRISGAFNVHFLINCKGKASGFFIAEGLSEKLNKDVIASLNTLQNWKPGKYKNENVDCTCTLKFIIESGSIKTVF